MHVAALSIIVPNYAEALAFYVGTLGFRLTADVDQGHKRWITVQAPGGGPDIVLARAENQAQRAVIGGQGGGRVWLFLETTDFVGDHAKMLASGVRFEEAPRNEPYGMVAVWRDPFGNRWNLIQRT
jgi:catechol 2,3-dioxygenase-like lactoylglutathione lyase family enzyme